MITSNILKAGTELVEIFKSQVCKGSCSNCSSSVAVSRSSSWAFSNAVSGSDGDGGKPRAGRSLANCQCSEGRQLRGLPKQADAESRCGYASLAFSQSHCDEDPSRFEDWCRDLACSLVDSCPTRVFQFETFHVLSEEKIKKIIHWIPRNMPTCPSQLQMNPGQLANDEPSCSSAWNDFLAQSACLLDDGTCSQECWPFACAVVRQNLAHAHFQLTLEPHRGVLSRRLGLRAFQRCSPLLVAHLPACSWARVLLFFDWLVAVYKVLRRPSKRQIR